MHRFVVVLLSIVLVASPMFAAKIPRPAPDLSVSLPNGQKLNLGSFRGKVVALEFLLTTCPGCKRTSQTMQKLYQEYAPKGFQPLGVAINPMPQVPKYVSELLLTYPVGQGKREIALQFLQHPIMMTLMMPQLVVIDRSGNIRAQYPGGDTFFRNEEQNMRKLLDRLLAEK